MKKRRIIFAVASMVAMIIIFCFSSQPGEDSKQTSGRVERTVVQAVEKSKNIKKERKETIEENITFIVRKTAHFTIYTVLGICLMGLCSTWKGKQKKVVLWGIAVFWGMIYASSDELHQWFVEERSSEITDVCLDTVGVMFGTFLFLLGAKLKNKIIKRYCN